MAILDRSQRWWAFIAAYFVLRLMSSIGRASSRFADTFGYFEVDYLGRESRLWPIPFIYSIVGNDTLRVAAHIIIGTAAWAFLAHVIARTSRLPHTMTVVVLLFGLSPQIVRFDIAILSESIGISLMVFFVAATLQYFTNPSRVRLIFWLASLLVFSMTRTSQLIIVFAITLVSIMLLLQQRSRSRLVFAAIMAVVSLWGVLQLHNNRSMSELNFYTMLQERVIADDVRFAWFTREGMPLTDAMRGPPLYDVPSDLSGELLDYVKLPIAQLPPSLIRIGGFPLAEWVRHDGWLTYMRYIVTHPNDTLSRLYHLSSATLNPADRDLLPLHNRTIFPRFFFLPWQWWAIAGAITSLVHLRRRRNQYVRFFIATTCFIIPWYAIVVLTSGIEHPRHAVTVAIALRISALVTILGLFDGTKVTQDNSESVIR